MKAPDTIYINVNAVIDPTYTAQAYSKRFHDTDIAYVRADISYELANTVEAQKAEIRALMDELVSYRDRIQRLRGALNRYGDHSPNCTRFGPGVAGDDCTCGFTAALKAEA